MTKMGRLGSALLLASLIQGCANIPSEAPELSARLGQRVSAIEHSHLTLLHRYFDEKRERVDAFIQDEWVPLFAEKLFSSPPMVKYWEIIVAENDPKQRLEFILRSAPKLQSAINEKRVELMAPLDALEKELEIKLRGEYSQINAINNTLTSFLTSASKVDENRNRYLSKLGIEDDAIASIINETDTALSSLLDKTQSSQEKAESFLSKLAAVKEKL